MSALDNARVVLADPYAVSHRETLKALARLIAEHERLIAPPSDDEREDLDRLLRVLMTTDDEDPENGEPAWSLTVMRNQILAAGFRRRGPITDEMVEAAVRRWYGIALNPKDMAYPIMRAALEAAEAAR